VYEHVRESYDRVAERYAEELAEELTGKPLDRALLRCLVDLVAGVSEASGRTLIADLGCGPGHVAAYLAGLGARTVGVDISPAMIKLGRHRFPDVDFRLGSLLALPAADGELAGAIAFYSIIHLEPADRPAAYGEMHRALTSGGWLLLAFHTSLAGHPTGEVMHADQWWGHQVDLDFHYIDPAEVVDGLTQAGFAIMARTDREPWPEAEHESRRCYLLGRRT
jgi:SAM-dependent methyltransferase